MTSCGLGRVTAEAARRPSGTIRALRGLLDSVLQGRSALWMLALVVCRRQGGHPPVMFGAIYDVRAARGIPGRRRLSGVADRVGYRCRNWAAAV